MSENPHPFGRVTRFALLCVLVSAATVSAQQQSTKIMVVTDRKNVTTELQQYGIVSGGSAALSKTLTVERGEGQLTYDLDRVEKIELAETKKGPGDCLLTITLGDGTVHQDQRVMYSGSAWIKGQANGGTFVLSLCSAKTITFK